MSSSKSKTSSAAKAEVTFDFKARYFTTGPSPAVAAITLVCFHGYGQLAPYFIRKFQGLAEDVAVIVPEGLHRFYTDPMHTRVGASWMTKEEREVDIANQMNYLEAVLRLAGVTERTRVVGLGFSQGAATLGRWVSASSCNVSHMILWAGMFPHDIDFTTAIDTWMELDIHIVTGDDDPYISDERLITEQQRFIDAGVPYDMHRFSGGHVIEPELLNKLIDRIRS